MNAPFIKVGLNRYPLFVRIKDTRQTLMAVSTRCSWLITLPLSLYLYAYRSCKVIGELYSDTTSRCHVCVLREAVIRIVINVSYPLSLVSALRYHSGINGIAAAYNFGIKITLVIAGRLCLITGITGTVESSYRSAVIYHCCSCRNGCAEQHDSCACYYSCLR